MKPIRHAPVLVRALAGALLACAAATAIAADAPWIEGRHYLPVEPPVPTHVPPGKVEVVEVFSFGCPACNQFEPIMQQIKAGLPPEAEVVYVPASWNAAESWPLFQRAFHVAQALGIEAQVHEAMYAAIWKTGELAVVDPVTHRLKVPQPTMGLVARFFARTAGVTQQAVLDAAQSFSVDMKMMESDQLVKAYGVEGTPTLIVAGKYRVVNSSVRSVGELTDLVRYLVERN
ncbi:MAG: thiol:disulfide interchange protein DsbA/DsbL [Steroidobacteraceae bacterium]|nr:thiol:disulfide interchange protein DsbA/DsbL [Steroidobacteraceae bacterium]